VLHQLLDQRTAARAKQTHLLRIVTVLRLQHVGLGKKIAVQPKGSHQIPGIVEQALDRYRVLVRLRRIGSMARHTIRNLRLVASGDTIRPGQRSNATG
jgi:hypothetical protein